MIAFQQLGFWKMLRCVNWNCFSHAQQHNLQTLPSINKLSIILISSIIKTHLFQVCEIILRTADHGAHTEGQFPRACSSSSHPSHSSGDVFQHCLLHRNHDEQTIAV